MTQFAKDASSSAAAAASVAKLASFAIFWICGVKETIKKRINVKKCFLFFFHLFEQTTMNTMDAAPQPHEHEHSTSIDMAVIMYLTLGLGPLPQFVDGYGVMTSTAKELVALMQGTPVWRTLKRRIAEDVEQLMGEEETRKMVLGISSLQISSSSSTLAACAQDPGDLRLIHMFGWDGARREDDQDIWRAVEIYGCSDTHSLEDNVFSFWEEALEGKDAWEATVSILPQLLTKDKLFRVIAKPYTQITRTDYLKDCGVADHGTGALLHIIHALGDLRQHVYNAVHGTTGGMAPHVYRMTEDDLIAYLCVRDGTEDDKLRRGIAMKPLRLIQVYLSSHRENVIPVVDFNHGGRVRALARWILGDKDAEGRVGPRTPQYGDVLNLFSVLGKPSPLLVVRVKTRETGYDGCSQFRANYRKAKEAFFIAHSSPLPNTRPMLMETVPPLTDAALAHLHDNLYNRYEYYKHKCVEVDDGSNPDRNTPVLLDDMYDVVLGLCAILDPVRLDHLDEECAQRERQRKQAEERLVKEMEMEREMEKRTEDEKKAYAKQLRETRARDEEIRNEVERERKKEERWRRLVRLQKESERRTRDQETRRQRKEAQLHVKRETTEKERRDGEEARRRAIVEDQERQIEGEKQYKEWALMELNKRCKMTLDGRMPNEDEIDMVVAADIETSLNNVKDSVAQVFKEWVSADLQDAGESMLLQLKIARARADALGLEIIEEISMLRRYVKTELEVLHTQCRLRKPSGDAIRLVDATLTYQREARRRRHGLDEQLRELQLDVMSKNKTKLVENIAKERHSCLVKEITPPHEVTGANGFPQWHEATALYDRQRRLDMAIVGQEEQKGFIVYKTVTQRHYMDHIKEHEGLSEEENAPSLSEAQELYVKKMCDQLDARCSMVLNGRAPTSDEITAIIESDCQTMLQQVLQNDPGSQLSIEERERRHIRSVAPTMRVRVACETLKNVRKKLAEEIVVYRTIGVKNQIEGMVKLCQLAPPEEDVLMALEVVHEKRVPIMKDMARLRAQLHNEQDPYQRKKITAALTATDAATAVTVTGLLRPETYDQLSMHSNAAMDILYDGMMQREMMSWKIIPLMQMEMALKAIILEGPGQQSVSQR